AACVVVVRTDGSGHAFRGGNGHVVVGSDRNRNWRAPCPTDLSPRGIDHGLEKFAHMVQSDFARGASVYRQRNETRLGICLALAHGSSNFRDDPDWFRAWPASTLRSRIERHGAGH